MGDYDRNLDGIATGAEAAELLKAIEKAMPGATSDSDSPMARDGSISLISLLRWFTVKEKANATAWSFSIAAVPVSVVGSGTLSSDSRFDQLSWQELRSTYVGYREVFKQVMDFKDELTLTSLGKAESTTRLIDVMPMYYDILAKQFEGDTEHLFELFNEVDINGNMALEQEDVEKLLSLVDPTATDEDMSRYVNEINLMDGPLSFVALLDWWDQARIVTNSLIAEKGATLVARLNADAMKRRVNNLFGESNIRAQWRRAQEENRLEELRDSYIQTFKELREYKLERDLRTAERECAEL